MAGTYHTAGIATSKAPWILVVICGGGQRRGHEHISEGAAIAFSEDGRLRNGLLHSGAWSVGVVRVLKTNVCTGGFGDCR